MRMRDVGLGIGGGLALALVAPWAMAEEGARAAFQSITKADLIKHVKVLASDELEGRSAGSKGEALAAEYIARHFKEFGLKPVGDDGSYFQKLPLGQSAGLAAGNRLRWQAKGGEWKAAEVEKAWTPFPFSANGEAKAGLVFAGYGITAPEYKYDDYAGLDVKGKVVLVLRHEPREKERTDVFDGPRHTRHSWFSAKARNAQERGAAALLMVTDPKNHPEKEDALAGYRGAGDDGVKIPVLHVKQALAREMLAAGGFDLAKLQEAIDGDLKPRSAALPVEVDLASRLELKTVTAKNVLGLLEGADPEKKKEIVVVGAHYDHLGYGDYGSLGGPEAANKMHRGADDNASGTASVIELARAFTTAKVKPRRSILFMTFTGEERGLVGSRHYVNHPVLPLADHVAMVNLDMVGRGKTGEFLVSGVGTSPIWPDLVETINQRLSTKVRFGQSGFAPSDNTSFFQKGIPVLFFFTGMHEDYHRPSDTWDKINQEQMEVVARYTFAVLHYLASLLDERPAFVRTGRPARAYLGIQGRPAPGKGLGIAEVVTGSPAEKAGLKKDDVITRFAGQEIKDMRDLFREMGKKKPGDEVELEFLRGESKVTVKVKLGTPDQ